MNTAIRWVGVGAPRTDLPQILRDDKFGGSQKLYVTLDCPRVQCPQDLCCSRVTCYLHFQYFFRLLTYLGLGISSSAAFLERAVSQGPSPEASLPGRRQHGR